MQVGVQVALIGSLEVGKVDIWVLIAVFGGIAGYIAKIYFTYFVSTLGYVSCNSMPLD